MGPLGQKKCASVSPTRPGPVFWHKFSVNYYWVDHSHQKAPSSYCHLDSCYLKCSLQTSSSIQEACYQYRIRLLPKATYRIWIFTRSQVMHMLIKSVIITAMNKLSWQNIETLPQDDGGCTQSINQPNTAWLSALGMMPMSWPKQNPNTRILTQQNESLAVVPWKTLDTPQRDQWERKFGPRDLSLKEPWESEVH